MRHVVYGEQKDWFFATSVFGGAAKAISAKRSSTLKMRKTILQDSKNRTSGTRELNEAISNAYKEVEVVHIFRWVSLLCRNFRYISRVRARRPVSDSWKLHKAIEETFFGRKLAGLHQERLKHWFEQKRLKMLKET